MLLYNETSQNMSNISSFTLELILCSSWALHWRFSFLLFDNSDAVCIPTGVAFLVHRMGSVETITISRCHPYQNMKFSWRYGDTTVTRPSYLHNGISVSVRLYLYTGMGSWRFSRTMSRRTHVIFMPPDNLIRQTPALITSTSRSTTDWPT